MAFTQLLISGYCGFADRQTIPFALPKGLPGSGLTYLVGPNNSGKSSIIESIHALLNAAQPNIPENNRNTATGRRVDIALRDDSGFIGGLRTRERGGGATEWFYHNENPLAADSARPITNKAPHPAQYNKQIFVLPSRRYFAPIFGESEGIEREVYMQQFPFPMQRMYGLQGFFQRMARIQTNRADFDNVIGEILSPVPNWHIDEARGGNNQSYISIDVHNGTHDTDALGDGVLSLFFIVDALYDSKPGQLIIIDEPELSLHPALQRKLSRLLNKYAKDRQIVISTHSPYLVDWNSLFSGAVLVRVINQGAGTKVHVLQQSTTEMLRNLNENLNNPHVLGLEGREIFFHNDPVILVEGQEDVVFYPRIEEQLRANVGAEYLGWGAGGAHNIKVFAQMLADLGYRKVIGIFDADKKDEAEKLRDIFPQYKFHVIPANDVRTKERREIKASEGLLDEKYNLRKGYVAAMGGMFEDMKRYIEKP